MYTYVARMFNNRNESSDFYFQTDIYVSFPKFRFEKIDIERIDEDGEKDWGNVRKLFQDVDFTSVRIFHNSVEFLIFPFSSKLIKYRPSF